MSVYHPRVQFFGVMDVSSVIEIGVDIDCGYDDPEYHRIDVWITDPTIHVFFPDHSDEWIAEEPQNFVGFFMTTVEAERLIGLLQAAITETHHRNQREMIVPAGAL